jgi:hypothetical protein
MAGPRNTIGDYLSEREPAFALWQDLLGIVFRASRLQANLSDLGPTARVVYLAHVWGTNHQRWVGGLPGKRVW